MGILEDKLKKRIINEYGSLKAFTDKIDMPWTTLDSILKRGVGKANITNILKITAELNLDAESLADGIMANKAIDFSDPLVFSAEERSVALSYRNADEITKSMVRRCLGIDALSEEATVPGRKAAEEVAAEFLGAPAKKLKY